VWILHLELCVCVWLFAWSTSRVVESKAAWFRCCYDELLLIPAAAMVHVRFTNGPVVWLTWLLKYTPTFHMAIPWYEPGCRCVMGMRAL
jgi:hypothetical protein